MPEKKENIEDKLIISFNDQFATNQNHGQLIFIQFLSAILVVLIGYGYVYVNTNNTAALWGIQKTHDTQVLISYAVVHLFGAYYVSELILTLLATVVLNIGYGFRRDQKVIKNIRLKYLSEDYPAIFGSASFDPSGKNLMDYLPEFNRMFVFGIFTLQVLLLISFGVALYHFSNWIWWYWWLIVIYLILLIPILWSVFVYLNYYKKYYWIMTDSDKCGLFICFKNNRKRWTLNKP